VFNNKYTDAEMLIEHTPVIGGQTLNVAIPIQSSSETSEASVFLNEIIQNISSNSPAKGETTNLNLSGFTLQKIVPNKPFFSYVANDKSDWIVFGILDAIPLNSNMLTTLGQIIKPYPLPTLGGDLFYNSSGPNTGTKSGEGIYISCKPTGSSEEEIPVEYSKNTTSYDILNNNVAKIIFQILIGCIIFIIIFSTINYAYTWMIQGTTTNTFHKSIVKYS
jgi:hypothetical protein